MKEYDKISIRLAQILIRLNDGEQLNVRELASDFNVTQKTIERDLVRLSYLPLQTSGKGKTLMFWLEAYALGRLSYKDIKRFALLSGVGELFPQLDNTFLSDLLNEKLNSAFLVKNQGFSHNQISRDEFEKISDAIVGCWQITCIYNNKPRTLYPYKMINNNGIWYMLADDEGKLKNFTLDKLEQLKFSKISFEPNKAHLEKIAKNETNWFSSDDFEVVLHIKSEACKYFKRKTILPNYKLLNEDKNGINISTKVAYDDEILRVVKYWLPFIRIISPISLQEKLNKQLQNYLNEQI